MSEPPHSVSSQLPNSHTFEVKAVKSSFSRSDPQRRGDQAEVPPPSVDKIGMVLQWADGRVQACNAAAAEILGFTLAQMQGCHYIDCPWQTVRADGSVFPVDLHPAMVALQTGQPVMDEVMGFYQPDGNLIWLQVNAQPLFQQDNATLWAVCTTFTPIAKQTHPQSSKVEDSTIQGTVQPQTATLVEETQEHERLLSEAVPAILFTNSPDGWCSYINQRFYDYTGMVAGSGVGWGWITVLHPDDQARIRQEWLLSIEQGKPFKVEYRLRQAGGAYRWFVGRSSPIYDSTGRIDHWLGVCVDVHDLKASQEELRRSEFLFRRLADVSIFGVAIGDFSGRMLYANDTLLNMIGYSRAELEAGSICWTDLTPPEYLHLDWQAAEELRQRGVATPFEKEYIHKDGHRVPILIGGALFDEPYAEQDLITGFYLDLSVLKQTQNSLQEALRKLNSHVENTPMAVVEWDANLVVRRWSGAAPQLFGWNAEAVLGNHINDLNLIYEEDIPIVAEVSQRILSGTEPQITCRNRNITKDGSILHCVWYNSTLTDSAGQVTSVLSLVLDTTEQVQAEESLRQSEERFRLAARAVAGMVYDWNVQTGAVYRSEGLYQLIGLSPEAVSPDSAWWGEQMHPEDSQRIGQLWQTALSGQNDSYDFEYRIRHSEGHWVHIWDQGYVIRDRLGQIIRVVGSSTDITTRKQIEQEREQLLLREQAAREQAEAVSRLKDEFLAAVSHELRTPLNPILGWSKILQTRPYEPEQFKQALAIIERNAKLQTQLVEDLLDIAQVAQGKLTLNRGSVELAAIISAALKTVQPAAEAKSITIQTWLDPTLQPILGDSMRLQQVVWNLLSNATKFTPWGGRVEIRLETANLEAGAAAKFAQITITDTGIGISPEFLPHIFEHFRQQDGTTTHKFGGLGLGLAIVKQIVELHGGTIDVTSEGMGQGATFVVRLPLIGSEKVVDFDRAAERTEANASLPLSPSPLAGLEILIVEDNEDSRDYLAFLLEQEQAKVTVATSAWEALQILSQCQPQILLSDIGLPEMNGHEFMRQIRQELSINPKQLSAIALTAYAAEYDQQQALDAGFQRHLAKPVEPEALIQAIAELVRNR